jgi:two-component system cell cycle sensor histidine kinase/response regulator CckA
MITDPAKTGKVVLLVDDEDSIRRLVRTILEGMGYVVLDAGNGLEGLAVCRAHEGPIDILISDVTMPELDGRDLAASARELRPDLKVLLMSAHSEEVVFERRVAPGTAFLQKPSTSMVLERKLRATLDSHPISAPL